MTSQDSSVEVLEEMEVDEAGLAVLTGKPQRVTPPQSQYIPMEEDAKGDRTPQALVKEFRPSSPKNRPMTIEGAEKMNATFKTMAMILGTKALLLMGMLGAFILALLAVIDPEPARLIATTIYASFVLLLYWRGAL